MRIRRCSTHIAVIGCASRLCYAPNEHRASSTCRISRSKPAGLCLLIANPGSFCAPIHASGAIRQLAWMNATSPTGHGAKLSSASAQLR